MRLGCRTTWLVAAALSTFASLTGPSRPAFAETTFEVVKAFEVPDSRPDSGRSALVVGSDGAFYGTTPRGGSSNQGTVFRIDSAGSFTTLHSFSGLDDGTGPYTYLGSTLVLGSDGALYGAAVGGSAGHGTVFRIDSTGTFATLHSFSGADGFGPSSALVLGGDGALYGTTYSLGSSGSGTIYRIDGAGNFRSLHSFSDTGGFPLSPLVQGSDGALYGTTPRGGSSNQGTVFRIDSAGNFTTLHSFSGADGSGPSWLAALAVGSDGALYGTTGDGGSSGGGTVFRIDNGGSFTTLHSFTLSLICVPITPTYQQCHYEGGYHPYRTLVLGSDGALYGTTPGSYTFGVRAKVFRIDSAGNFTWLSDAPEIGASELTLGSDGSLYGTTAGSAFRIDSAGALTNISSSDGTAAAFASTLLTLGRDGALYATTSQGGLAGLGAFVRIDSAGTFASLYSFRGAEGGQRPLARLVPGSDGALYGTTEQGGPLDMGTVFRIDSAGSFTSLHSFSGTDGAHPTSALVPGSDGALYGTTPSGGSSGPGTNFTGPGTIFKIDSSGSFVPLHSFAESLDASTSLVAGSAGGVYWSTFNGVYAVDAAATFTVVHSFEAEHDYCDFSGGGSTSLAMGVDGALYGIHSQGFYLPYAGCYNSLISTFFRIDGTGTFTALSSFGGTYGSSPLVVGSDGAFYGTASDTIFRIDRAGNLTTFQQEVYSSPFSPSSLIVGADGALYGTTLFNGASSAGTVFRLDSAGNFTTLHSFTYGDGSTFALTLGRDGALYGTTRDGGPSGAGTVFRIDSAGAFTSLHAFEYTDGYFPSAPPTLGGDCALYGIAPEGGPAGGGVVYRIFEAGHLCQRIHFDPVPDRTLGDPPSTVTATASSGLPVSFSASGRCKLSGDQVVVKRGVGVCRVTASQVGDSQFEPAAEVTQEFRVWPPRRMRSLR